MTLQSAIQERIVALCREKRITLNVLSAKSGLSMSCIDSLIRNRSRQVSIETIEKICCACEISLADFFCCDAFRMIEPDFDK